jgi:hypothetical protein
VQIEQEQRKRETTRCKRRIEKLSSDRIIKSTMNLPSHAFEGSFIAAEYSIILEKGTARSARAFSF